MRHNPAMVMPASPLARSHLCDLCLGIAPCLGTGVADQWIHSSCHLTMHRSHDPVPVHADIPATWLLKIGEQEFKLDHSFAGNSMKPEILWPVLMPLPQVLPQGQGTEASQRDCYRSRPADHRPQNLRGGSEAAQSPQSQGHTRPRHQWPNHADRPDPLPECGEAMTIRTGKGGRYRYYACLMKARRGPTACEGMAVPMESWTILSSITLKNSYFSLSGWKPFLPLYSTAGRNMQGAAASISPS